MRWLGFEPRFADLKFSADPRTGLGRVPLAFRNQRLGPDWTTSAFLIIDKISFNLEIVITLQYFISSKSKFE